MIIRRSQFFFAVSTGRKVFLSFSAIGNTAKLLSTKQMPNEIHCLHGMRFFSMAWVVIIHSFFSPLSYTGNTSMSVSRRDYLYCMYFTIVCIYFVLVMNVC